MNFFKNYGQTTLLIAMIALAVGLSCGGKSNPGSQSESGSLVCGDGEAWIEEGKSVGYIFAQEGDLIAVAVSDAGRGDGRKVGTYSASGDQLTLVFDDAGYSATVTYKISGGKLTLSGGGETKAYTKRTGLHVDIDA